LATRMLLGIGNFFSDWGLVIVGCIIVLVVATFLYVRTPRGHYARDRFSLRVPAVGDVLRFAVAERFCRILGAMLRAGVPVPEAMTAATEATNNRVYISGLSGARDATLRGEGISRPIADTELFPKPVEKMLRVGEESGTLDQQLESAADYCESERSYKLKRLTTLFEPAVIVFMGVIVGFVAIALVSAMYGIFDQVKLQ
jgi:type IV pilus assembly protein PilC